MAKTLSKTFAVQTTGTIYAAFMVKVDASIDGYFLHLGGDPVGTTFTGKGILQQEAPPRLTSVCLSDRILVHLLKAVHLLTGPPICWS